jgi:O-antigen ligase
LTNSATYPKVYSSSLTRVSFFCGFVSMVVSLNFLDPINWPKQIALLTITPLMILVGLQNYGGLGTIVKAKSCQIIFILPLLLFIISGIFSPAPAFRTLWGSYGRSNGIITYVCLLAVAFSLSSFYLLKLKSISTALYYISGTLGISAIYGIMQYFKIDPLSWSNPNAVFGFFGNSNFASACWALGASLALALLADNSSTYFARWLATLLFFLNAVASWLSASTQGPLAIIIFAVLLGTYFLAKSSVTLFRVIFSSLAVLSIPLFLGVAGYGFLADALEVRTVRLRIYYWLAGIEIGNTNPIFGAGVDSYGDFYRSVRPVDLIRETGLDLTVNNAHNGFIQVYATMGIVGLIAYSIPMLVALKIALFQLWNPTKDSYLEHSLAAIYVVLLLLSLISIDNISISVWTWFYCGVQLRKLVKIGANSESKVIQGNLRRNSKHQYFDFSKGLAFIISIALFAVSWVQSLGDREIIRILQTPVYANDATSIDNRTNSLLATFREDTLQEPQIYVIDNALRAIDRARVSQLILEGATRIYPRDFGLLDRKASILESQGSIDLAITTRIEQSKLDPVHPYVYYRLAVNYTAIGDLAKARYYLNKSEEFSFLLDSNFQSSLAALKKEIG